MITSKTKAWLSSVLVLIVTVLFFSACSSEADEGVKAPPSNLPQAQIITELQEFNNSLVVMPESRRLKWFQWFSVVLSDAVGAYQGSVFGIFGSVLFGANASYSQYVTLSSQDLQQTPNKKTKEYFAVAYIKSKSKVNSSDYSLGISYHLDSCSIYVGILHNKILDCIEDINEQDLIHDKDSWSSHLSPEEKIIYEDKLFTLNFTNISNIPPQRLEHTNTKIDAVMQLYLDAIKEKCQNDRDFKAITDEYIRIVKKSTELSAEEKQNLYNGFSVMAYSFNYWSIRWPYTKVD